MGFLKSVGKAIAGPLASLIPGAGAILGPLVSGMTGGGGLGGLLGGLGGSAMSAFGGSGTQGKSIQDMLTEMQQQQMQNSQFNNQFNTNQNQTQQQQFDPLLQAYRNTFLQSGLGQLKGADQPLYGDATLAGIIGQQNDLSKDATASLRRSLAATGRMDSGAADQGISDIETSRFGNIANFQTQLPLLNEQVKQQRLQQAMQMTLPYMGLGFNTGTTSTGSSTGSQSGTSQSQTDTTGKTTQHGTVETQGPSFWKNMASNVGGMIGGNLPGQGVLGPVMGVPTGTGNETVGGAVNDALKIQPPMLPPPPVGKNSLVAGSGALANSQNFRTGVRDNPLFSANPFNPYLKRNRGF